MLREIFLPENEGVNRKNYPEKACPKTYMAYREKYKALILKYVPCISKYVPYIFRLCKCHKNNVLCLRLFLPCKKCCFSFVVAKNNTKNNKTRIAKRYICKNL